MLATQDAARCRVLLERLKRNGTWQVPTLVNIRRNCTDPEALARDGRLGYVPESFYRAHWLGALNKPGSDRETQRERCRLKMGLVGKMMRKGVPLLAGSDAANPFVVWGFALHDELELLVEAGLSPLESLQTATLNPARFLNRADSLGTIEPGKLADLVLLDANPLDDIRNTQRIAAVVLNGRYLDRQALDELLAEAGQAGNPGNTTDGWLRFRGPNGPASRKRPAFPQSSVPPRTCPGRHPCLSVDRLRSLPGIVFFSPPAKARS